MMKPVYRYIFLFLAFFASQTAAAQDAWYDHYANARDAIPLFQWQLAVEELEKALQQRTIPELEAETYALRFEDYVPYFLRGVAYYNLGEFEKANADFDTSLSYGVVTGSLFSAAFQNFRAITKRILRQNSLIDSLQNQETTASGGDADDIANSISRIQGAIRSGNISAAEVQLSQLTARYPEAPSIPIIELLIIEAKRAAELQRPPTDPLNASFQQGLQAYLAGSYQESLDIFREILQASPDYPQASDWSRRILREMAEEGIPPDTVKIEVKTRTSVAPVISIAPMENPTREDTVQLSGSVRDDRGIQFVEYSLNGQPFTDSAGEKVRRIPQTPQEATSFNFQVKLPLRVGENQITVTARDADMPQFHVATEPLLIIRKLPIYKTPGFLASMGILALLLIGGVITNIVMKRRIAFVNKYNPYIAGAPVRNEKMFYGRERLLRRLINNLHNNSLMIYGPRRIGKTSLLHQLKKKLEEEADKDYFFVPVYIDLQGTPESKFFSVMMHDINEGCEPHLRTPPSLRVLEKEEAYSARDFNSDIKTIIGELRGLSNKTLKLVLLIDEVDELNNYADRVNQKLRSIFMKTFAENLVAVMSGTHIRKRWESEGSPWYNFFEEIEVTGIDHKYSEALIRTPVKGIFHYDDAAVRKIIEYSDNIPYRIQKFCVNAVSRVIDAKRRRITAGDIEQIRGKVLESIDLSLSREFTLKDLPKDQSI